MASVTPRSHWRAYEQPASLHAFNLASRAPLLVHGAHDSRVLSSSAHASKAAAWWNSNDAAAGIAIQGIRDYLAGGGARDSHSMGITDDLVASSL